MIRFKCPACDTILKILDEGAGRKINCPKCGQRMLVPAPEKPAATNKTMLGQLTPSPAPDSTFPTQIESDSLVLLGLQKDAELEGRSGEQADYKPARSWAGTLCLFLALALAIAAMPVAVIHHPLLGAGLAGLGMFLSVLGLFVAARRHGAGCGLSLAGTAICGSILVTAILLYTKGAASDDREIQADAAKQNYWDERTEGKEGAREADREASRVVQRRADKEERNRDAPKRRTSRHEEEEPATDRTPRRPSLFRTELDRIIEQLKSDKTDERIAAAERLRKMGEKARPAARALCEAIVSPSESVRRAALEALEKADPALYKQVVLLVVDENAGNHIQASKTLASMGAEGAAAVPVLLSHARKVSSVDNRRIFHFQQREMLLEDIAALAKLGPGESEVAKLFVELIKFTPGAPYNVRALPDLRLAAFHALVEIGKSQADRRKKLMPVFIAAIDDGAICIAVIKALGEFGKDAKAAIPKLRDLKLSPSMAVRDAARTALEKIEKDAGE